MCGIVGYVGFRDCQEILLKGLGRLEYRGYDSAGVAIVDGSLHIAKCAGKVRELELRIAADPPRGSLGIGHTRWATWPFAATAQACWQRSAASQRRSPTRRSRRGHEHDPRLYECCL